MKRSSKVLAEAIYIGRRFRPVWSICGKMIAPRFGTFATLSAKGGSRPDLLDAKVAGFSKCDSRNTMPGPLKGFLTKDLESVAMVRERDDWGYYVRAIRDLTHPPSWRWRIIRWGKPMGVLLEAGGFSTYEAARFAGNVAFS